MEFLPVNTFELELPFLVVKNEVMKYTCPAHTPRTKSILRMDIQVWVEADEAVTIFEMTRVYALTFEVLLVHILLQVDVSGD